MQWKTLISVHGKKDVNMEGELELRVKKMHPGDGCVLVYTSGTTGNPKAVILCHDNMGATAKLFLDM